MAAAAQQGSDAKPAHVLAMQDQKKRVAELVNTNAGLQRELRELKQKLLQKSLHAVRPK